MSATAVIPEEFVPMGPMWKMLPVEVVWEILLFTWMLDRPYCAPNRIFDKQRFDIINRLERSVKIRSLGKAFAVQCMQLMYLNNKFVFKAFKVVNLEADFGLSLPPPLPPVHFRSFLRRMQIHLTLEDHYTTQPSEGSPGMPQPFGSAEELVKYSPGAKLLRNLTSTNKGFPKLELLDLHIHTYFHYDKWAAFDLVEAAAFTVRAREVKVDCWLERVANLIKVELME